MKIERDENGERHETNVTFLRSYSVFNLQQTEGLPERFHWSPLVAGPSEEDNFAATNQFFENAGIDIVHGADLPHYSIVYDRVGMPPIKAFPSPNDFFSTLAHEAVHWTGHPRALHATSVRSPAALRITLAKNSWRNSAPRSCVPTLNYPWTRGRTTRNTLPNG